METIVVTLGVKDGLLYQRRLIDGIAGRDVVEADQLMDEHIVHTIKRLKNRIRRTDITGRSDIAARLAQHRAFWKRKEPAWPLASFRVGDFTADY